jgi:hypothetical protein
VPEATVCPPSVVADTIMRTIELGVTITEAAGTVTLVSVGDLGGFVG